MSPRRTEKRQRGLPVFTASILYPEGSFEPEAKRPLLSQSRTTPRRSICLRVPKYGGGASTFLAKAGGILKTSDVLGTQNSSLNCAILVVTWVLLAPSAPPGGYADV